MKKVEDVEESSFGFKVDDCYPRKTTVSTRLMVDAGATSHIIRGAKKSKNYDQSLQPENLDMEQPEGTKNSGIAWKRADAEVCLLDADKNPVVVTLKKALLIPFYPHDIFSIKFVTTD